MKKTENQQAAEIVRQIESRVVWFVAFLVARGSTSALNSACAKAADEMLDEYQSRFPAITPPE